MIDKRNRKALLLWRAGKLERASSYFKKLIFNDLVSRENKTLAEYMLAYLYNQIAYQQHDALCVIGINLNHPYVDPYFEAGRYLATLSDLNFNPADYDLPLFESVSLAKIASSHPRASIVILSSPYLRKQLSATAINLIEEISPRVRQPNHSAQAYDSLAPLTLMQGARNGNALSC